MARAFRLFTIIALSIIGTVSVTAQTRPATSDFKVKYRVTYVAGGQPHSSESVTMIKGARERSENRMGQGFDMTNITQCDLKRTIQINDSVRKYSITPMETDSSTSPSPGPGTTPAPASATPSRTGGTVTYVTSSIDTGERREMFGFTARHVKSVTTIQSSPDACNPVNQRTEIDGWYIDLNVAFDCNQGRPPSVSYRPPAAGGCRDQTKFRREGNGKLGYPLIETMRMMDASGQITFSTTKEVLELSRETLDIALFDVPTGYTQAMSQQELYGAPSATDMMGVGTTGSMPSNPATPTRPSVAVNTAKQAGVIRVGVVQINNKAGKPISQEVLRQRLIGNIQTAGIEAVPLNGISPGEVEAEAKAKQCDYILYTDLAALKMSKLGGLFGSVTGTGGIGKTEAKMEFKLFAVGETSPRLQSTSSAKEEGDDNSAGTAVDTEARTVVAEIKKRRG
jgi:hypothetical protein